jgi:hypothetical protein
MESFDLARQKVAFQEGFFEWQHSCWEVWDAFCKLLIIIPFTGVLPLLHKQVKKKCPKCPGIPIRLSGNDRHTGAENCPKNGG